MNKESVLSTYSKESLRSSTIRRDAFDDNEMTRKMITCSIFKQSNIHKLRGRHFQKRQQRAAQTKKINKRIPRRIQINFMVSKMITIQHQTMRLIKGSILLFALLTCLCPSILFGEVGAHLDPSGHGLNCYACSTMDNEACRYLKPRSSIAPSVGLSAHMNTMSSSYPTASSFVTARPALPNKHNINHLKDISSSPSPIIDHRNNNNKHDHQQEYVNEFKQGSFNRSSATSATATGISSLINSSTIRSRACIDDEYFCSVVSIVRLEFVNNNFVSKFWALERNCSKSCNHGCIVIGERIKLRMCNECCNTPNCNVGDHSTMLMPSSSLIYTMLAIALVLTQFTISTTAAGNTRGQHWIRD